MIVFDYLVSNGRLYPGKTVWELSPDRAHESCNSVLCLFFLTFSYHPYHKHLKVQSTTICRIWAWSRTCEAKSILAPWFCCYSLHRISLWEWNYTPNNLSNWSIPGTVYLYTWQVYCRGFTDVECWSLCVLCSRRGWTSTCWAENTQTVKREGQLQKIGETLRIKLNVKAKFMTCNYKYSDSGKKEVVYIKCSAR